MTTLVQTAEGLLPLDALQVTETRKVGATDIAMAREWFYEGRLVRRDAWVTLLRGVDSQAETGKINGQ